jgi:hypothetical protein
MNSIVLKSASDHDDAEGKMRPSESVEDVEMNRGAYRRRSENRGGSSYNGSRSRSKSRGRAVSSFFGDSDGHSDGNSDGEVAKLRAEVAALQRKNAVEQARHVSMDTDGAVGVSTNSTDNEATAAEKSALRLSRSRLAELGHCSKERRSRSRSKSRVALDADDGDDDWGVTHL